MATKCNCSSKSGAGYRRWYAYDYVKASLEEMFREQNKGTNSRIESKSLPSLRDYFHTAIRHCIEFAKSGNVHAKKQLPEIFFRLALYYENGDIQYGITRDIEKSNKFLDLAISLEDEHQYVNKPS